LADWQQDVRRIQHIFRIGDGRLVDDEGIDWWALLSPHAYQRFYEFLLLEKLAREIDPSPALFATREHPLAHVLGKLLGTKPAILSESGQSGLSNRFSRYVRALRTLTPAQIRMISGDKWDADYRVRRFFSRSRKLSSRRLRSHATVLIPSSYRNVSRTAVAYARRAPESNFLLVATRVDGFINNLPNHVDSAPLAAYAPRPRNTSTEREIASLSARWKELQKNLLETNDKALVHIAGLLAGVPRSLSIGLRIRDAWRAVFEREKIETVLCGDENNWFTRLPVLLAKKRGVHTVHCSHGALDSNILLRGTCSDTYLAKGEMEKDYLVEQCRVPREQIVIGAPPDSHHASAGSPQNIERTDIVFFSEPYELYAGRTESLYRELLVNLCAVARQHNRKVVLKLHPFESVKARSRLVDQVLDSADRRLVEVSCEPMSERLLQRAWFGLTVESSTAVECALAGVPSFLCGWFDLDLYAYARQYQKFGAAKILDNPADLLRVPNLIASWSNQGASQRLADPITHENLSAVLQGRRVVRA
jgi:hypothetical protein